MMTTQTISPGLTVYRRSDAGGPTGLVLSATDTHAVVQWDDTGGSSLESIANLVIEVTS